MSKTGGSGAARSTICFSCEERAINWKLGHGGHSTCYCLDCLPQNYSELDYNTLDLSKNELIRLIFEAVE